MLKRQKILSILLAVIIIIPLTVFHIDAAAGTIYESEDNDISGRAKWTYDDYDNYGRIDEANDVDWWKISFASSGMANFWLGEIPSDCNFDLYLYKSDATTQIAQSKRTSNANDQVRCHVKANTTYYVKIAYNTGTSSSYYKFRVKNYADRSSYIFSFPTGVSTGSGYVAGIFDACSPRIGGLGFTNQDIINDTAASVYNVLPNADIVVIYNDDSEDGRIGFKNSDLYGKTNSDMTANDRALSAYTGSALSQTDLIIFAGPNTAGSSNTYGSLVDQARTEGAYAAIGWMTEPPIGLIANWTDKFFFYCDGANAYQALARANTAMTAYTSDENELYKITYQDWGSSRLTSLVLDQYY